MNKLFCTLTFIFCTSACLAQFSFGLTGGIFTPDIDDKSFLIVNDDKWDMFRIQAENASYGVQAGIFALIDAKKIFIMPEVIFNSNKIDYTVEDIHNNEWTKVLSESYQAVDLALMLGPQFGPLRIGVGPVAHWHISSSSELFELHGFEQNFKSMKYAWQAGLGLDVWVLHLELRYEGNFNRFGDHFSFFGETYEFDQRPSRWLARLGFHF